MSAPTPEELAAIRQHRHNIRQFNEDEANHGFDTAYANLRQKEPNGFQL